MRFISTLLAYIVALAGVAAIALVAVLVLAGPHAGLLPRPLEIILFVQGWIAVVVLPVLAARWVWMRRDPQRRDRSRTGASEPAR